MTTKELLDEYGAIYLKTTFCMGNCQDNDVNGCKQLKKRQQEIIKEIEASIRKEVVEEVVYIVDDHCSWYNANNQIPDTELDKGDEHWDMIRKVVQNSLKEVSEGIIKQITLK